MKQIEGADFTIDNPIKEEYLKKLLVIEPLEFERDVKTVHGTADAVRANVYVVLSADGSKYEAFEDTLIFARAMARVLKGKIGKIVAGRLIQGEAKRGQDPPWLLDTPGEKDLKAAAGLVAALNVEAVSGGSGDEGEFDEGAGEPDEEPAF